MRFRLSKQFYENRIFGGYYTEKLLIRIGKISLYKAEYLVPFKYKFYIITINI